MSEPTGISPEEPRAGLLPASERLAGSDTPACDSCGCAAPDVVGPILVGMKGWGSFEVAFNWHGRRGLGQVLLCPPCTRRLNAGDHPQLQTLGGGRTTEPEWCA